MSVFNRKRTQPYGSGGSPVRSVRFSNETMKGLEAIKKAFRTKYPLDKFPTLSALLDQALVKYLAEIGDNAKALKVEVADFKARYTKPE